MSIPVRMSLEQYQGNGLFVLTPAARINYLDKEMAITRLQMVSQIPNVSPTYGTSTFAFLTGAGTPSKLSLATGYYQASGINATLLSGGALGSSGSYAVSSLTGLGTLTITTDSSGKTPQLCVTEGIAGLLGIAAGTYPPTAQTTTYSVTGTALPQNPVAYVQINSQMTDSDPINFFPRSIACFLLQQTTNASNQPTGMTNTLYQPTHPLFFPVVSDSYARIALQFLDQNSNPLPVGSNVVIDMLIRPRVSASAYQGSVF